MKVIPLIQTLPSLQPVWLSVTVTYHRTEYVFNFKWNPPLRIHSIFYYYLFILSKEVKAWKHIVWLIH